MSRKTVAYMLFALLFIIFGIKQVTAQEGPPRTTSELSQQLNFDSGNRKIVTDDVLVLLLENKISRDEAIIWIKNVRPDLLPYLSTSVKSLPGIFRGCLKTPPEHKLL